MARLNFAIKSLTRYARFQSRRCPYCGADDTRLVARKKLLLELRRCLKCFLMFRYPKDEASTSASFYEDGYSEGTTTDLPDAQTLERWIEASFSGTEKDLSEKIEIVRRVSPRGRLLDYGCSWGYGLVQFGAAGFQAYGYEISHKRARFARERLGMPILESPAELEALPSAWFQVIFVNHVLEHLYDPRAAFQAWCRLLAPDGVLLIFVPNAGGESARKLGPRWGPLIGEKHPLAIDATFLSRNLLDHGLTPRFASSPYARDGLVFERDPLSPALSGDELLALAISVQRRKGAERR